ncbi:hypothetical protein [Psychrobacter sp. 1044]|uniref:hypothetical protein n=1 Tax=Psychrobacter sp. 1044 TaxID=2772562 RepID=UPI001917C26B|nr:hypothetical protein [Psychrobacter sp. 1044]
MSNSQSKVLSVCAWFFGITFLLAGFGILLNEGGLFSGLLIMIGSCLLLPPIKRLILDKKPNLSRGKITAAGSILILIGCFAIKDTGEYSVADAQPSDNVVDKETLVLEAEPEDSAVEESGYGDEYANVNDEIASEQGYGYEDEIASEQGYEEIKPVESKRSKLPNPFLDFGGSINTVDNTPVISIVSKNKEMLNIYNVVINDGLSCEIFNIFNDKPSGTINFGEKFDLLIVGCSQDQVIEVKIITDKGYVTMYFE